MQLSLTLPALERLIGGDTELELELRHQIVENFAKKHLKNLINDEAWKHARNAWNAELGALVKATCQELVAKQSTDIGSVVMTPTSDLGRAVKLAAQRAVDEAVRAVVESQKRAFAMNIQAEVSKAVDFEIDAEVERRVRARLEAARALCPAAATEEKPA